MSSSLNEFNQQHFFVQSICLFICRPLTKWRRESNPGRLGGLPLCYAVPPILGSMLSPCQFISSELKWSFFRQTCAVRIEPWRKRGHYLCAISVLSLSNELRPIDFNCLFVEQKLKGGAKFFFCTFLKHDIISQSILFHFYFSNLLGKTINILMRHSVKKF